jgi:hypothetical protein
MTVILCLNLAMVVELLTIDLIQNTFRGAFSKHPNFYNDSIELFRLIVPTYKFSLVSRKLIRRNGEILFNNKRIY